MAVFVASSDEATDGTADGRFLFGGWVARELLWTKSFTPRWQRLVLDGPPKIPYLHMVDIKSPKWQKKYGLSETDVERRLDAAFELIDGTNGLFPITYRLDAGHLKTEFADVKLLIRTEGGVALKKWQPDYVCFLHYALDALNYVNITYPDAKRLDFVVERNGPITKHIQRFHRSMAKALRELDRPDLAGLVGRLIPDGKDRVPLQVADLLCWHTQASENNNLSFADGQRYKKIANRKGLLQDFTREQVTDFAKRAHNAIVNADDEDARH